MENIIKQIQEYIKKKYGVSPEYPWAQYPDYATYKDPYSDKWFGITMLVGYDKLGMDQDGQVWIINVKADRDFISFISGTPGYRPAYHMNKASWVTLLLDGSLGTEEIFARIDSSYEMVANTPTRRIYEAVKRIPKGRVATYGTVAAMAGEPKMARAVGNALHKNPDPASIPCHRVVNSKGQLSGSFAFGGAEVQADRLRAEGVEVVDNQVDLATYGFTET